ncbi:hypothetical protein OsJ_31633 [Oryza sativa Japonica Group]|uniref:UspA domain-containing protein n=1 Tax=Oryza sativa subsp. japonica TaxID=39947 RepID=B9G5V9_ORYSJ|nr:hypothetical protein OsJ_31633 [Oryza sativa Japonica Group]
MPTPVINDHWPPFQSPRRDQSKEIKNSQMKVLVAVDDRSTAVAATARWPGCSTTSSSPATGDGGEEEQVPRPDHEAAAPELVLVHAMEPLHHVMFPVGPGQVGGVRRGVDDGSGAGGAGGERAEPARQGEAGLRAARGGRGNVGVEGEPRKALCGAAKNAGAGLVVVGSRGLGAIKRAFLGSVSDYCAARTARAARSWSSSLLPTPATKTTAATARATVLMMDRHYIRKTSFRGRKRSRERDFFTIVAPAEC